MGIDADFLDLMPHTIKIHKFSSVNQYGTPTYATSALEYRARVVYKTRMLKTDEGQQLVTRGVVYVHGDPKTSTKDKITLPNGDTPKMVFIEHYPDESGDNHEVIHFV